MSANAVASSMLTTVVGLQVFAITGNELDLGLIGLAQFVPVLVLSPFTGTIADRFDRRVVFAVGLVIDVVATVGLLLYAMTDPTTPTLILLLVAFHGVGRSVGTPASRALPIDLAPEGTIERVVAVRSLLFQISMIVGPLAGALANRTNQELPYWLILGAYLVGLGALVPVPAAGVDRLASTGGARRAIRDALDGLVFIRRSPIVLGAISLDLFAVLFGGATALLPAIVEKRLDFDDVDLGVGLLRAAFAGGAALCALGLSIRPLTQRAGPVLYGVIAVFGLGTIMLGVTRSFAVAFVTMALISAADQISVFIRASVVPLATPESMRGRVLAVENVFIGGSNQLGAFESGVTAAWFGLAPAIVIGGLGTLVVVGASWRLFPSLRSVDRIADVTSRP